MNYYDKTKEYFEQNYFYLIPVAFIIMGFLVLFAISLDSKIVTAYARGHKEQKFNPQQGESLFHAGEIKNKDIPPMPRGEARHYISASNRLVPVLMYHHIRNYVGNDKIEAGLSTEPAVFKNQIDWLKANGFNTITFSDLFSGKIQEKSVILTFDDGYRDNYTDVFSRLKENGQRGEFFIITGAIGNPNYMTKEMLKEMSDSGMEIESHTINHIDMSTASKTTLDAQITGSKATLEEILGKKVEFLCYPSGKFNALAEAEVKAAGYKAAVTTQPYASSANLFEIPRVRMNPGTSSRVLDGLMRSYLGASNRFNWTFQ